EIAEGNAIFTIAYQEPGVINNSNYYTTIAEKTDNRYYLSGTKYFVSNAHLANQIIVVSRMKNTEGLIAFLVSPELNGVTIKSHNTFGKDSQSIVELDKVELGEENVL